MCPSPLVRNGSIISARISPLGCAHKVTQASTCRLSFLGRLWSLSQCAVALRHGMPGSVLIVLLEFLAPFTLNTRQNANDHLGPFFIITHQRERSAARKTHHPHGQPDPTPSSLGWPCLGPPCFLSLEERHDHHVYETGDHRPPAGHAGDPCHGRGHPLSPGE